MFATLATARRVLDPRATADPVPVMRLGNHDDELFAEQLAAVAAVAERGAFTLGHEVEAFEAEFAAFCGSPHAIGVSSGTDALVLTLRALGIGHGDEVIVPTNSFIATAEAVALVGATARLVDVDPVTHLLTADIVAQAIVPATRCVIPVHLMGATVDMPAIVHVARAAGIAVVEDTAQAHGARWDGQRAGTFGDAGCFSFYPTKNLGGWGDGGAIVTADDTLADRIRLLRCHGERPRYEHRLVGTTARLDAVQAAVLRCSLRRLDAVTDERRRLGAALREGLDRTGVELPHAAGDHVYHLFVVRSRHRMRLREHLAERGVHTAVHYPAPIHRTEAFAHTYAGATSLPVAERLSEEICTLPLFPGMSEEQLERVVEGIRTFDRRQHASRT